MTEVLESDKLRQIIAKIETIDQIIADKVTLSESILSDDSSWLKDLNTQTFMDLIKLRQEALSGE